VKQGHKKSLLLKKNPADIVVDESSPNKNKQQIGRTHT
jgi:hypothetical protein